MHVTSEPLRSAIKRQDAQKRLTMSGPTMSGHIQRARARGGLKNSGKAI
jgi:hypothetical protein